MSLIVVIEMWSAILRIAGTIEMTPGIVADDDKSRPSSSAWYSKFIDAAWLRIAASVYVGINGKRRLTNWNSIDTFRFAESAPSSGIRR